MPSQFSALALAPPARRRVVQKLAGLAREVRQEMGVPGPRARAEHVGPAQIVEVDSVHLEYLVQMLESRDALELWDDDCVFVREVEEGAAVRRVATRAEDDAQTGCTPSPDRTVEAVFQESFGILRGFQVWDDDHLDATVEIQEKSTFFLIRHAHAYCYPVAVSYSTHRLNEFGRHHTVLSV